MQLLQHFKELTIRPKNAKELKGLILQLAIQGKLTANWREENSNIESASELYEQIELEKEKLIELKRIKKEKKLAKLSKDEFPYEIPEKWNWCRLVELSSINGGFAFKSSNYIDEGARVIRISDFDENGFKDHKIVRYLYSDALESYVLEDKNILIAMTGGTVGKSLFVDKVPEVMVVNQRVATIKIFKPIYEAYVNCVIPTKLIQDVIEEAKNSTNDNISMSNIKGFKIPLPPLEEQKEIVKVVETLFKEVEQLEQLTVARIGLKEDFVTSALNQLTTNNANQEWAFLQDHFKSFFNEKTSIKKLRETVLQLAVQGKLTADWRENNPDVELASDLINKIKKAQLKWVNEQTQLGLKEASRISKKILNSKLNRVDIEIPNSWVWSSLIRVSCAIVDCHNKTAPYVESGIPLVRTTNIKNGKIIKEGVKFITQETYDFWSKRLPPEPGDIIYTREAPVGEVAIIPKGMTLCMGQRMMLIRLFDHLVSRDFLLLTLMSPEFFRRISKNEIGMGVKHLRVGDVEDAIIALPPLEEQKAIVKKVNALMGLCDALEQEVQQSQEHIEMLMQSVLREVFEGDKSDI